MYKENDNLNMEEIEKFRNMTQDERDKLMEKYEKEISEKIKQSKKQKALCKCMALFSCRKRGENRWDTLDNDFNLYSFMPWMYPFITNIKADYLIASHIVIDSYVFIIHTTPNGDAKCDFLCCSAFTKGERDYETNQRKRALLKKECIHIPTNTTTILLDKLNNQSSQGTFST